MQNCTTQIHSQWGEVWAKGSAETEVFLQARTPRAHSCSSPLARLHLLHPGSFSEVPVPVALHLSMHQRLSEGSGCHLGCWSRCKSSCRAGLLPHTYLLSPPRWSSPAGLGQKQWMPTVSVCFVNPLGNSTDNPDTWLLAFCGEETTALTGVVQDSWDSYHKSSAWCGELCPCYCSISSWKSYLIESSLKHLRAKPMSS